MLFSKHPDVYGRAQFIFQFFSVLLSKSPAAISNNGGSIQLYRYIAARDEIDGMLNYMLNYSRDSPVVVRQARAPSFR